MEGQTMIHKNWLELIKPQGLDVEPGADPDRVATAVAEPLERGFGLTLGNALRRVLLSSLQGAAVNAVQIDGVLHEFSSVPGVREDVTDIVLNLKGLAVSMDGDGPKRLQLNAKGPGVVTAADIAEIMGVEIINKDHVICHLDEGASVSAPARAMSPPTRTAPRMRPSASSPWMRCIRRSNGARTRSARPARARCWTTTSCRSSSRPTGP
jgi:hypothetical protein